MGLFHLSYDLDRSPQATALGLITDIPKHLHRLTSGEGRLQHGRFLSVKALQNASHCSETGVRELRCPDTAVQRPDSYSRDSFVPRSHFYMPQTSHVCSPRRTSRPQRHGGGRVRTGVGSRSPAPTGQSTVPHDAPHHVGIRVAWFLSQRSPRALQHAGGHTETSPPRPCPSFGGWKWPWTRSCREGETISIC